MASRIRESKSDSNDRRSPNAFRTTDQNVAALVTNFREGCEDANQKADECWLLSYLATFWGPHVPDGVSRDFYRGMCHGLRIELDVHSILIATTGPTQDVILLTTVFVALAGVAAEHYFAMPRNQTVFGHYSLDESQPSWLLEHRLCVFQIDVAEAECWANASPDTSGWTGGPAFSDQGHPAATPEGADFRAYIEHGDSADFYLGVLYALQLCSRTFRLFRETVFLDPPGILFNLERGMDKLSHTAAQLWRATTR